MSESRSPAVGMAMTAVGVSMAALGISWVAAYVYRAVGVLHEPDRSWLFWGLSLVFAGLILLRVGVRLAIRGTRLMRASRDTDPQ